MRALSLSADKEAAKLVSIIIAVLNGTMVIEKERGQWKKHRGQRVRTTMFRIEENAHSLGDRMLLGLSEGEKGPTRANAQSTCVVDRLDGTEKE